MSESYKVEVEQHSSEWNQITAQLQLAAGRPSLRIINLFKYNVLMDRSSNDTAIDALIDVTDLKSQFQNRVIEKNIPLSDLIFICGHISVQKYKLQPSKVFKLLLCALALGKIAPFSEGFQNADSLVIQPDNLSDPFHYNVLAKSYEQYEVKYQISFVLQDDNLVKQLPIFCCLCTFRLANLYCKDQKKHYCENCSSYVHPPPEKTKSSKLAPPRHELQAATRSNSLPLCESHADRHQFYCLTCEKYLCQQCARQSLHKNNQEHPIRPIEYLYSQKHQTNAQISLKHKQKLTKMLAVSQQKLKQIVNNYQQARRILERKTKQALQQLQFLYKQRLVKVQNDLIQLQLQLQKIDCYSQFVKKQEEVLKPINYFKIQARFQYQIKRIKMNRFGSSFDVWPDLDHYCLIEVGTHQQIKAVKQQIQTKVSQNVPNKSSLSIHNKIENDQNKTAAKLLSFNPNSHPARLGDLSLKLQNGGSRFFKIGNHRQ